MNTYRALIFPAMALSLALCGCADAPRQPEQPRGAYRPINRVVPVKHSGIDFFYAGDISGALQALQETSPQLQVLPPVGTARRVMVRVSMIDASLDDVLGAIGAQGAGKVDVVLKTSAAGGTKQAYLRFRA